MKLVTIQNRSVLNTLLNNKSHFSDFNYVFDKTEVDESDQMKAYQVLMKAYNLKTAPIFCGVLGCGVNFYETKKSKNRVLLKLDVPNEFIHLHTMTLWLNIQYLIIHDMWTPEKEKKYIDLLSSNMMIGNGYRGSIQAIIPVIFPEWLVNYYIIVPESTAWEKYYDGTNTYLNERIFKEYGLSD